MSTHAVEPRVGTPAHLPAAVRAQMPWLAGGLAGSFLVPFVLADQLSLPKDLYYGIYGVSVLTFLWSWTRATSQPWRELVVRHWRLAVVLGLVCGALLMFVVLRQDATTRPAGVGLVAAIVWRGLFYGAIDGLLLSSFPILLVFAAFKGTHLLERLQGKIVVGLVALVASMVMTATYHLGYSDFRSSKLRSPVAGDVVWSMPTLLTLNPIGAPIAHATLHTTAVLHSYHTDLFLPPHR
ncbi:MAG: hypothetical protein ACXVRJ_14960 [Gaiellaceae bacterium]